MWFLCFLCLNSFFRLSPLFWAYAGDLGVTMGFIRKWLIFFLFFFFFFFFFYYYGVQGSCIDDHKCKHTFLISFFQWS